jgi:hypothetical protein
MCAARQRHAFGCFFVGRTFWTFVFPSFDSSIALALRGLVFWRQLQLSVWPLQRHALLSPSPSFPDAL